MTAAIAILAFVTLQRLAELVWARRNTARLMARGAKEVAPEHYSHIVAVHTAWILGLWYLAWNLPVNLIWLAVFAVLQVLRLWVLWTLGDRWTTRIIVPPGEPPIAAGPYRFMSHPNYAIVAGEIFALPMVFGLFSFALLFTVFNAAVLYTRIRAENAALGR